ncbi:MAG: hypothetical protein PHU23_03575 [Dehalococcoidales bacterium]|nr:hypothetical protein [Dehalococcoidales bacterium]
MNNKYTPIINKLLDSDEPSIRYKVRVNVLDENPSSASIHSLQGEIKSSQQVKGLLVNRDPATCYIPPVKNPYRKWQGAHWILASLADIGYPKNEIELIPLINQTVSYWLQPKYVNKTPLIEGRYRRCASQQGNILFSILRLFDFDNNSKIPVQYIQALASQAEQLAQLLIKWQWPDGGWNCDVRPSARKSSFWESLIPFRALALYAQISGDPAALASCRKAAQIFFLRKMYLRISDGQIMNSEFTQLHYPCYWHYDILFGLKCMAEAGSEFINNSACKEALDLLVSKQLPDCRGWPAEAKWYSLPRETKINMTSPNTINQKYYTKSNTELVSWGNTTKKAMNEWVTTDALYVLKSAGRLSI